MQHSPKFIDFQKTTKFDRIPIKEGKSDFDKTVQNDVF